MSQFPESIASHYHQRTKYAPETIAQKAATSLLHPTSNPKSSEIREEGIGNKKEIEFSSNKK